MLFKSLLPSLLAAATVKAVAVPSLDDGQGELVVMKRDAILDARDLELAEMHNVNLTEMYKHSEIKRDDGDDIHFWVSRSFEEEEELEKRQQRVRLADGVDYDPNRRRSDRCKLHSRDRMTNSGSPFKGGVDGLFNWGDQHSGSFKVDKSDWQPLLVAGSNSGANAVYRVQVVDAGLYYVGTKDVRNDADWTRNNCATYDGRIRCSSTGRETCQTGPGTGERRIRYQVVKTNEQA